MDMTKETKVKTIKPKSFPKMHLPKPKHPPSLGRQPKPRGGY